MGNIKHTHAQVVKCKGCNKVFAACVTPYAYQDKDWQKDVRKYSLYGHEVKELECSKFSLEGCHCNKSEGAINNPEQASLF